MAEGRARFVLERDRDDHSAAGQPDGLGKNRFAACRFQVYLHVDCDVLQPGIVATDYAVPDGLTLGDLHDCAVAVTSGDLVGVEIAEYEGPGSAGPGELLDALRPAL